MRAFAARAASRYARPVTQSPAQTSALLLESGFRHAFFGRTGGFSPPPWASLNFASNTGDDLANIAKNLEVAAATLGVPAANIYFASQVHGVEALEVTADDRREEVLYREADATFAMEGRLACGVRSADCGTLLVGDRASGAALAIHAGWRGVARAIVPAAIGALRARLGGEGDLVVSVGPMIEACCFEVGEDVARELASASSLGEATVDRARAKPHVDLRRVLDAQLASLDLDAARVEHVRGCTVCQPDRYFSFRREGKVSGRMLAAIVPRG